MLSFDRLPGGEILPVIHSVGRSVFDPIWAEMEHADPVSELMYLISGSVEVRTPDYSITGRQGDTIYTPAGTSHRDIFDRESRFEVYLVQFSWPGEAALLAEFMPQQLSSLIGEANSGLAGIFHILYQEFAGGQPYAERLVSLRTLEIILMLCRQAALSGRKEEEERADGVTGVRRRQLLSQAKLIIRDLYSRPVSLRDIADRLNISTYYLSHIFSRESGFTLSQYLTEVRMENAVRLLGDPRLNISEVAHLVGFGDNRYFRKVFKAFYGMSPRIYRDKVIPGRQLLK